MTTRPAPSYPIAIICAGLALALSACVTAIGGLLVLVAILLPPWLGVPLPPLALALATAAGWAARALFGWWRRSRVDADALALAMVNHDRALRGLRSVRHVSEIVDAAEPRAHAATAIGLLRG